MKAMISAISLLILSVGCAIVPTCSKDAGYGQVITPRDAESIVIGVTTADEVVRRWAFPHRELWQRTALGYSWEVPRHTFGVAVFDVVTGQTPLAEHLLNDRRHAFFVAFDERGIVTKKKFVTLSARKSLDEDLESWAKAPAGKSRVGEVTSGRR